LLGSQLRERTDELAIATRGMPRDQWIHDLGSTLIFKIHRSFSWSLLLTSGLTLFWLWRSGQPGLREPKLIFAMVIAMMAMGIVLGHISVYQVVQVMHVGTTAVLLAVTWHWIVRLWSMRET
jgi:heme A synthase